MTPTCVRCERPTADGYACSGCTTKAAGQLAQIADMCPAARDVAHGLSRRGGGGTSGKPGSRLPIDLGAMAKLDAVQNELTTWMRHVAEERGLKTPQAGTYSVYAMADDPIEFAALWLTEHLEWWRHRAEVDEFLRDVQACARVVAGVARGPTAQRYLGPCGAVVELVDAYDHEFAYEQPPCDGDIYAREGAQNGSCRLCGAQVSTEARRAWLDAEVRSRAFRAAEIAGAYGINVKTIRSWAERGQLIQRGIDRDDRPLYLVGDVLDLAAESAARRETDRSERARRAATKATESEGAAA